MGIRNTGVNRPEKAFALLASLLLLAAVAFALFGNILHSFFMGESLDYFGYVTPRIIWHNIWGDTSYLASHYTRCAPRTMWCLERYLFGTNPFGYHVVNLLIHIANAFLLVLLVKSITGRILPGLLGGIIFVTHSVAAICARWEAAAWDSLMALFYLAALLLFARYRKRGSSGLVLGLVACSYLVSLLSKEMALSFPILLLLWDFFLLKPDRPLGVWLRRNIGQHLVIWATTALFLGYTLWRYRGLTEYSMLAQSAHQVLEALGKYFQWFSHPLGGVFSAFVLTALLILGRKPIRVLAASVLVTLLPIYHMAEKWRVYLPLIFFCALMGILLSPSLPSVLKSPVQRLLRRDWPARLLHFIQPVILAIILLANCKATYLDNIKWDNNTDKARFVAEKVKTDHPTLPWGTEIYIVGIENAKDKALRPTHITPPIVFLYDEAKVEAFPFRDFYFNRAASPIPSPERFWVYEYKGGRLRQRDDLKRELLIREALSTPNRRIIIVSDKMAQIRCGPADQDNCCFAIDGLSLPAATINTIEIDMAVFGPQKESSHRAILTWRCTPSSSQRLSATSIEFPVPADGSFRTFRLPVGALASWVFARRITALSVCLPGLKGTAIVRQVRARKERFKKTAQPEPEWPGFDRPFHRFAMPRYLRMPRQKLMYFLQKR